MKNSKDEMDCRIKRHMEAESNSMLTQLSKTSAPSFYEHFRFFDDSQIRMRAGVPIVHCRGFCIHCEEQYNAGITDCKPDLIARQARSCRSHLEKCKHYHAFLSTNTGQRSVTKENIIGLEKRSRKKLLDDTRRNWDVLGYRDRKIDEDDKNNIHHMIAVHTPSIALRLQHKLLMSTSDQGQEHQSDNKNNNNFAETETAIELGTIFDQIVPLAEAENEIYTIAKQQLTDTLNNLRHMVEEKKRKLEEALLKLNSGGAGTASSGKSRKWSISHITL
jgi:hypothetical protein